MLAYRRAVSGRPSRESKATKAASRPVRKAFKIPADERGSQLHAASPAATQASSCTCVRRCEPAPQICGGPSGVASATLVRVGPDMPRRVRHTSGSRARAARIRSVSLIQATSRRESGSTAEYHQPSAPASTRVVLSHGGKRPGKRYSTDTPASRSSRRRRAPWRFAKHAVRRVPQPIARLQNKTRPRGRVLSLPERNCLGRDISTWRRPEPESTRSDSSSRRGRYCR
jgi:hypothetical protein